MAKRKKAAAAAPEIDFSPADSRDQIQITFDFEDSRPDHFHGIRMLLQHSLGSLPRFDSAVSALADACSGDKTHGTVITAEGDDEVFAFAAAVDLTRDKDLPVVRQVREALLESTAEGSARTGIRGILDAETPAVLILHERMVNLPPQLVPPLHRCLLNDLHEKQQRAGRKQRNAADADDKTAHVVLAPIMSDSPGVAAHMPKAKKRRRAAALPVEFQKFEDEVFAEAALAKLPVGATQYALVMSTRGYERAIAAIAAKIDAV